MLARKGVNSSVDIYGIGAVLYEMVWGYTAFFARNIRELFVRIKYGKLKFPKYVGESTRSLLRLLLARDPNERPSFQEIKQHEFFAHLDWEMIINKQIPLPNIN